MRKKLPQSDPVGAFQRKATASRRVGVGAQCACGEKRPMALIEGSDPKFCAACDRKKKGQLLTDKHHVAGKANSPVKLKVHANDHRADLSPAQYDWPNKTLENSDSSPVLASAARSRGYLDTDDYLKRNLLAPNAEMLEALDAFLVKKLGPKWWVNTELERFAPRGEPNDKK